MFFYLHERSVIKLYSKQLAELTGEPIQVWRERVKEVIKGVHTFLGGIIPTKINSDIYSFDEGDKILRCLKDKELLDTYGKFLGVVRFELMQGSTEDDIKEYYNIPRFDRELMEWSEKTIREIALQQFVKDGSTYDDAVVKKWKIFPMYFRSFAPGVHVFEADQYSELEIVNRTHEHNDNYFLPTSLKPKIDRWRLRIIKELSENALKEKAYSYTTFNAFIRDELRKGNL